MMPPPGFYPKPPREKSFARAIFMTLATTIFGLSLALNVYLLMISGIMNASDTQQQKIVEKGDPLNRILVLSITGIINDEAYESFHKQLKTVEEDKTAKAIVVEINSPGGSVTSSDQIYRDILKFKAKTGKPVVIYQNGLAASGGYYISCAGDYIVAQRTTLTGNIGVLFMRYNVSEMLSKWGVQDVTLRSQKSPFKNAESITRPEDPKAAAYLQAIIEDAYQQFSKVVADGRSARLKEKGVTVDAVADGRIYTANEGLKVGLVDELSDDADAAYREAAKRAGQLSNPQIVRIKDTPSLRELLGAKGGINPVGATSAGLELNAIKIDAGSLQEMLLPKIMYLWDGN